MSITKLPKFTIEMWAGTYEAVAYGPTWNGWATPIVTRETYAALIKGEDPNGEYYELVFDEAGVAILHDFAADDDDYEPYRIVPDDDGHYDLGELGWTFETVDPRESFEEIANAAYDMANHSDIKIGSTTMKRVPTPNECVEPAADALLLARVDDGCELFAEIDHGGDYPTVELHATTPWDTHVHLDSLTVEQIETIAARLLRIRDELRGA